jgi:hypothetical protein
MSRHMAYRRQPVDGQNAQNLKTITLAAPTRGIVMDENEAYMQPGGCIISDNWAPTLRGLKLRGGCIRWCVLPETTPVISGFEYLSGNIAKMFAGNATKLYDVTNSGAPVLVKSGQTSGNYAASQLANASGDVLVAVNDAGDPPLRFNGTSWIALDTGAIAAWANSTAYAIGALAKDTTDTTYWRCLVGHTSPAAGTFAAARTANPTFWTSTASDGASWITGPAGRPVAGGRALVYVWKYRNRLFFIEASSMNAWYLPLNSVGGVLQEIPLSGAATKGGRLLFGATWSIDAGDGIDDKCVFVTDQGEVLVFTGSNPSDAANWKQEGRYSLSPPMGMNAWASVGGDLLIATVDGIVPVSASITKTAGQLELAMITRSIRPMWREEVLAKRAWSWTIKKWDEYGGIFVTWPGGSPGNRYCAAANNATGAWCRFVGYDATCFMVMRGSMYFGTQGGIVMQADRTGYDDGVPYVATLVGGWETFGQPSAEFIWHQARAVFTAPAGQMFIPQLSATVDYTVTVPQPPPAGPDPGVPEVWDQGKWDQARWDQASVARAPIRNTLWVSIGKTGFAHAPIVQVTVAQQATPNVELIAISATFEPAGVNV